MGGVPLWLQARPARDPLGLKRATDLPSIRRPKPLGFMAVPKADLAVYKPQRSPANEIPQTSAHHAPRWWLVALEQIAPGLSPNYDLRGARNPPRAGPNHPRGVRSEYNRLDSRRLPGCAAPPTRVREKWYWVWCTGARLELRLRRNTTTERLLRTSRGSFLFRNTTTERFLRTSRGSFLFREPPPSGGCKTKFLARVKP
jgi:hypothetical protein